MSLKDIYKSIKQAQNRIENYLGSTPLVLAKGLSKELGCKVWLKLESQQPTGSFKIRGAFNKSIQLSTTSGPLVTASSGNHGVACCEAWQRLDRRGLLFVPNSITQFKEAALAKYSNRVELRKEGVETCQTEIAARQYADSTGLVYISPYNDIDIVCGQGTCGLEILSQLTEIDVVFVPVGGGGLMSGIAAAVKYDRPSVTLVGCQPINDAVMYKSIKAGHLVNYEEAGSIPTIVQSTSGSVEPGSITFSLCRDLVDDWCLLSELQIAQSVLVFERLCNGMLLDAAAGLVLSALYEQKQRWLGKNVVLIISSANVGENEIKIMRKMCAESH